MCAPRCYDSKPKRGAPVIKNGQPSASSNSSGTTRARFTARNPDEGPSHDDAARVSGRWEDLRADTRDQVYRSPEAAGDVGVAAVPVPSVHRAVEAEQDLK